MKQGIFEKYLNKKTDNLYVVFRIGIGALFFLLGFQKIFGLWGMPGGPAVFGTLIWFAGVFELMIGSALVFGVLTRLASFFGVIMMAVAYYLGHVSVGGWNPAVNMGIAALIFGLAFLVTFAFGAKKASLEKRFLGKELF
ncbi:TPA: DoxX family protein [Candidatus Woesearchaeota archaeon]|nr:DoxX family protein [Candidatus Woesearchaeota archaeon]